MSALKNWQKVVILAILVGGSVAYSSMQYEPPVLIPFQEGQGTLENDSLVNTLTGHSKYVTSAAISPDGQILATGSDDKTIKLWKLPTGELLRTLSGHANSVISVAISPDGQTLASGSSDNTIKLWKLSTGELLHTLSGHTYSIDSIAISPNGETLVSGGWDYTIKLWNLRTGELRRSLNSHDGIEYDASKTGGLGGVLLRVLNKFLDSYEDPISVAISPDGQAVVSCSYIGTIELWNLATGQEIRTLAKDIDQVTSIAISPNGQILATATFNEGVQLWDLRSGNLIGTLSEHLGEGGSVTFSPDGQTVVSSSNKTVNIWHISKR